MQNDLRNIEKALRSISRCSRDAAKVGFVVHEVNVNRLDGTSVDLICSVKPGIQMEDAEAFFHLLRKQMSGWFLIKMVYYHLD